MGHYSKISPSLVLMAGIFFMGVALAQTGSDPLAAICQGFLSTSGLPAPGNSNVLCGCLVREVQSNLSVAEMQAYQGATQAGRPPPSGVENKVATIAVRCLSEAQ